MGKVIIGNRRCRVWSTRLCDGLRCVVWENSSGDFIRYPEIQRMDFEDQAMKEAAKTWTGEWWTMGGGGTAWDAMAYDPELNLLYIGVGNGTPWNREIRSPRRRRQFISFIHCGIESGYRRARVVLSDDARRQLGFLRQPSISF